MNILDSAIFLSLLIYAVIPFLEQAEARSLGRTIYTTAPSSSLRRRIAWLGWHIGLVLASIAMLAVVYRSLPYSPGLATESILLALGLLISLVARVRRGLFARTRFREQGVEAYDGVVRWSAIERHTFEQDGSGWRLLLTKFGRLPTTERLVLVLSSDDRSALEALFAKDAVEGPFVHATDKSRANDPCEGWTSEEENLYQRTRLELLGIGAGATPASQDAQSPALTVQTQSPVQQFQGATGSPWRLGCFATSLLLFVIFGLLVFSPADLFWVIVALLFHESGHYWGMRYFGFQDVRMFFVPFLGAATVGKKKDIPTWQHAIILLLGPLPGLLLGCAVYFIDIAYPLPQLRTAAAWLVALNFLNLMPIGPLDGGKLCQMLVFRGSSLLESGATVLSWVLFAFVFFPGDWFSAVVAGLVGLLVAICMTYRQSAAALSFQSRWPVLPADIKDFDDVQLRDLFRTTRHQYRHDRTLAYEIGFVHLRSLKRPINEPVAKWLLLGAYLAAISVAVFTASMTHLSDDTGRWPARIAQYAA